MKKFIFILLLFIPLILYGQLIVVPDSINWHNKKNVELYVKSTYPTYHKQILKTIQIESSFNPFAKNKNSTACGFMQVTKTCCKDLGYSYEAVRKYPFLNIHVGRKYLMKCLRKANFDFNLAYEYYNKGLYFDSFVIKE